MTYKVKVSLKKTIVNPMICVICGSKKNLHPRGHVIVGATNREVLNYSGMFYFPVCDKCSSKSREIFHKKNRFRTKEEKSFLNLYEKKSVYCRLHYRPLFGIKSATFTFNLREFAEEFERINYDALI